MRLERSPNVAKNGQANLLYWDRAPPAWWRMLPSDSALPWQWSVWKSCWIFYILKDFPEPAYMTCHLFLHIKTSVRLAISHSVSCPPSPILKTKDRGGMNWFGKMQWPWWSGWIKLHSTGGSLASMSQLNLFSLWAWVFFSFSSHSPRSTKDGIFNLLKIKPGGGGSSSRDTLHVPQVDWRERQI